MTGALDGIRVLDFTWYAAGPSATKYFADNGATVIKIESRHHLDSVRNLAPWLDGVPGVNRSQFFGTFNSSKKSVTLNMQTAQGRRLAMALVPHVDVVIDSMSAGTMAGWGMGYEDLAALKQDIIQLSTCMQGQDGPRAKHPGLGTALAPLSGFDSITGYEDGDPIPAFGAYTDFVAMRFIAIAVLAALDHRRRTGQGQYIDLSQYEAALHFLAPPLIDYFATGTVMGAHGNRSARYSPHGAYRCADEGDQERWIAIAVETEAEWRDLLRVLGAPAAPPEFDSAECRIAAAPAVDEYLAPLLAGHDAASLTERLQAAGVAAYPVQSCLDMRADENLDAFGFWPWLDHPECGPMPYDGPAYRLTSTPMNQSPAPLLGQHNAEILGGLLGLTQDELARLADERIVY